MKYFGLPFSAALPAVSLLAISLSITPAIHASVIYSTGFEPPAFTPGLIAGQDGWAVFGTGISTIEAVNADSGTQAVFVDGSTSSQSGPFHSDSATGPLVDLSADLFLASSSNQTEWQFGGLGSGLVPFLGGFDVNADDTIHPITATGFTLATTWTRNVWHSVDLLFDVPAQTYSIALDGIQIASGVPFCGGNGTCTGAPVGAYGTGLFDTFGGGNDSGFLDNFQVASGSVPEPASILLLTSGMGLVLCRRVRNEGRGPRKGAS